MTTLTIVGTGMGMATLTKEGEAAINKSDLIMGGGRMIAPYETSHRTLNCFRAEDILQAINETKATSPVLIVSGDVGFYSAARQVTEQLSDLLEIVLVPGISSLTYFAARLKKPLHDVYTISCHGREKNLIDAVRRQPQVFALTGQNTAELAAQLVLSGFGELKVIVGSDLGLATEKIETMSVRELKDRECPSLTVLWIENEDYCDRVRFGIPDQEFVRGDIPMTKAPVRAQVLAALSPWPTAVCYDVGCGTGSVTVELALACYEGKVYAIDDVAEAINLTEQNILNFQLGNVVTVSGTAPQALENLPAPDLCFIGGSKGNLSAIIDAVLAKNSNCHFVITAIKLDSCTRAMETLESRGLDLALTQTWSARGSGPRARMLVADNPIFIISGKYQGERSRE